MNINGIKVGNARLFVAPDANTVTIETESGDAVMSRTEAGVLALCLLSELPVRSVKAACMLAERLHRQGKGIRPLEAIAGGFVVGLAYASRVVGPTDGEGEG